MKVQLTLSIEVDRFDWAEEYGTETDAETVRQDVKTYFINHLDHAPAIEDANLTLRVR